MFGCLAPINVLALPAVTGPVHQQLANWPSQWRVQVAGCRVALAEILRVTWLVARWLRVAPLVRKCRDATHLLREFPLAAAASTNTTMGSAQSGQVLVGPEDSVSRPIR